MTNIANPFAKIIFEFIDGKVIEVEPENINYMELESRYDANYVKVTIELFAPKAIVYYGKYAAEGPKKFTVRNMLYLEDK